MTDRRPRHEQIAAELRDQILSGDLAPGSQIPSTAQLVAGFDAANATIQRALRNLRDEGFLDSRVGKGVYVRSARPFVVDVAAYLPPGSGFRYELLDVGEVAPTDGCRHRVRSARKRPCRARRRLLWYDGATIELSASYYAADLVAGTPWHAEARSPAAHRRYSRGSACHSGRSPTASQPASPPPRRSASSRCPTVSRCCASCEQC